ncbi:MAG: hypothetical protein M5R36_05820 [Deltaproteobacteria bacterium]|nr:hypothetical protein [Deltaproteobacteria bacterium]
MKTRIALWVPMVAVAVAAVVWMYPEPTRSGIDVWFDLSVGRAAPWGMIFGVTTGVIAAAAATIAVWRAGPLANAVGAALTAALVASVWYFPKGLGNLLTYAGQMRLNEGTMSPATLTKFYISHLSSYYLGVLACLAMLPVVAAVVLVVALRKPLSRHFFRSWNVRDAQAFAFVLLWLAVPAGAFFFITIQNEMNTVPLMPPMTLMQAFLVGYLFLPYSRRRQSDLRAGGRPPWRARFVRAGFGAVGAMGAAVIVASGLSPRWCSPETVDASNRCRCSRTTTPSSPAIFRANSIRSTTSCRAPSPGPSPKSPGPLPRANPKAASTSCAWI